ncbi:hypothetical protein G6F32_015546 [Rhizopus arrhizus]|nr:hypothetical protein G6F32_015546 [Rhizopus arrhizus]
MGDIGHAAAVGQLAQGLGQAGLLPPLGEAEGGLVAEVAGQAARGKPGPVRPFGQAALVGRGGQQLCMRWRGAVRISSSSTSMMCWRSGVVA